MSMCEAEDVLLKYITPPKFNSSPLKMDGWNTVLFSFWDGKFSGANC